MTKFTPGQWRAEGFKGLVVNDANGNTLALAPGGRVPIKELQANARLIAAAPALYAALKGLLDANPDLAEVAMEAQQALASVDGD